MLKVNRASPRLRWACLGLLLIMGFLYWTYGAAVDTTHGTTEEPSQPPSEDEVVGEDEETPEAPFSDYTESQLRLWDSFGPVCHFLPHEIESPVINKVDMKADTSKLDYNSPDSLTEFCAPYVYTRLVVDWTSNKACADDAPERGSNCGWYHMCIWDPEKDIYISKAIYQGDLWERFFADEMMKSIAQSNKKGIVIDAGANIGQYTLLAASAGQTVFAFEPIPEHTEMIKKSVALNGWSKRVHLYQNGLADYRAKTYINTHSFNKGGATIQNINMTAAQPMDGRFTEKIPLHLILLDDTLPDMKKHAPGQEIIFWKADIEGYESRMFRGSIKVIDTYKPSPVAFEVLGKSFILTECDLEALLNGILDIGYSISSLRSGKDYERDELATWASYLTTQKKDVDLVIRWQGGTD